MSLRGPAPWPTPVSARAGGRRLGIVTTESISLSVDNIEIAALPLVARNDRRKIVE